MRTKVKQLGTSLASMLVITQLVMLFAGQGNFSSWQSWLIGTSFGITIGMIMFYGHRFIHNKIREKVSWLEYPIRSILLTFTSGTVFTVTTICLLNYIFWIAIIGVSFQDFINANWFSIKIAFWMYVSASLVTHALVFYTQWKNLAIEQERQKTETLRLRFEALRNHVNPHFLFNSLSSLVQLIRVDQDKAIEFTNALSEVFRCILESNDKDLIYLAEEMKLVGCYLHLQEIRYGTQVNIINRVDSFSNWMVIPISVQMIIENVFKHNIISRESRVNIELWIEDEKLFVTNNINHKDQDEAHVPSGLANIRARYQYLSNKECIFEKRDGMFVVALPLLESVEFKKYDTSR